MVEFLEIFEIKSFLSTNKLQFYCHELKYVHKMIVIHGVEILKIFEIGSFMPTRTNIRRQNEPK